MTSVFHELTRKKPAWLKRRLTRLGSSVSPGGSDGSTTGNGSSGLQNRESSYQYTYIQLHGLSHPSPFFSRGLVFPKNPISPAQPKTGGVVLQPRRVLLTHEP